jgi:hypothetical protein
MVFILRPLHRETAKASIANPIETKTNSKISKLLLQKYEWEKYRAFGSPFARQPFRKKRQPLDVHFSILVEKL